MDTKLQNQLFERYPAIFAERTLAQSESGMGWGITTGDGWFHLIDSLCACLQWETDHNGAPQVVATQVKEKFGRLRFSTRDASERQSGMVDLASEISGRTCDVCSAMGSAVKTGRRLLATRCEAHTP